MGCGTSTPEGSAASLSQDKEKVPSSNSNHSKINGHTQNGVQNSDMKNKQNGINKELRENGSQNNKNNVPKPVAFEVGLDITPVGKAPPKRIQPLDPIENAPKLTAEMLEEKLRAADEKRAEKLENIRETSRKSTKLRSRIFDAQQFEMQRQNDLSDEITEKQKSADLKKEMKKKEMEEKRRLREERARRVRERAKEMRGEADLEFDLEKDENFNYDEGLGSENSWLTDGATTRESSGTGERIYSGRESPAKKVRPIKSAEQRARILNSASTTDSFDFAFQRNPSKMNTYDMDDDFFDT